MKKRLALILAMIMCVSVIAAPGAQAQGEYRSNDEETVAVPVEDINGNLICTVEVPARVQSRVVTGAVIFFMGVKSLVYKGATWVCMNPELTAAIIEVLISVYFDLEAEFGSLIRADHDGDEYVSLVKESGESCIRVKGSDRWQCLYSV